jgi:uncharacterized protein
LRYKVDLKSYMAECEANYLRLHKLLPGFDESDCFELGLPGAYLPVLRLDVVERTPYTSLVTISQIGGQSLAHWIPMPCLKVRLYHDANLAEVVNCAGTINPRPRYEYPNDDMHQPDEKAQWCRFLSEWLSHAIRHGFATSIPCDFVD